MEMTSSPQFQAWKWIILALALSGVPFVAAILLAPTGMEFLGALINPADLSVYLAAMRQGEQGLWLSRPTFTPETLSPQVGYVVYVLLGHIVAPLRLPNVLEFHLARLGIAGITLWLIATWLKRMRLDADHQRDAFLLIAFSGGFGWICLLGRWILPDVHMAEWTVFLNMLHAPHFILGVAGEILVMMSLLLAYEAEVNDTTTRETVGGALIGALGVSLSYPYNIVLVAALVTLYVIVEVWTARRLMWKVIGTAGAAWVVLGPLGLYYALIQRTDPFWQAKYVAQNVIPSPPPLETVAGLGLVGILAAIGIAVAIREWKNTPPGIRLCAVWSAANLVLLYAPLTFQRRFALGMYTPVCILATWGLHQAVLAWLDRITAPGRQLASSPPRDRLRRILLLLLTVPTTWATILLSLHRTNLHPHHYYQPLAETRAAAWLAQNSDESAVVLVGLQMGDYMHRLTQGRVFASYNAIDLHNKFALVKQFFDPDTRDEWRRELIEQWGITHVYYGRNEQSFGPPPAGLDLEIKYQADNVIIYQVK